MKTQWKEAVLAFSFGLLVACGGSDEGTNSSSSGQTGGNRVPASFDLREGASDDVWGTVEVNDGKKIYVFGKFTEYNGRTHNRLVRLHADGSEDDSFDIGWGFNGTVRAVWPSQSAPGKIYVGGSFTELNGISANRIIRLNKNGTVDARFDVSDGFDGTVTSIIADPNNTAGDIYVGGWFDTYKGQAYPKVIRLKVDGSIDRDFDTERKMPLANSGVNVLMSSPDRDSKDIYVGGTFKSYDENKNGTIENSERVSHLIRLNDEGEIDPNFKFFPRRYNSIAQAPYSEIGIGGSGVHTIAAVDKGSTEDILVGGSFNRYRDQAKHYNIIRLRNNGDIGVDSNFGKGFDSRVRTLSMVNGKIMVGGDFTRYRTSLPARKIARLSLEGVLDDSFASRAGFNSEVLSIVQVMNSEYLYVGGRFDLYRETFYGNYIRLDGEAEVAVD